MKTTIGRKWNNGDMELSPAQKRVIVGHSERLDAPARSAFLLACPVAAALSLDHLLGQPTRSFTVSLDEDGQRYDALLASGDRAICRLQMVVADTGSGGSEATITLTCTALSEQVLDRALEAGLRVSLARLAGTIKDRCRGAAPAEAAIAAGSLAWESDSETATASACMVVQADPDACFALACPVAELEWIDGWCFDLIYSNSGHNEDNNIFLEQMSPLGVLLCPGVVTCWYTTLFDPETRRFHALLLTPGLTVARFEAEMDDLGDGRTRLRWDLTCAGLTDEGQRIVSEPGFAERMRGMLELLARSARHYVETGRKYRLPASRQLRVLLSLIGAAIGRHLRRVRNPGKRTRIDHAGAGAAGPAGPWMSSA